MNRRSMLPQMAVVAACAALTVLGGCHRLTDADQFTMTAALTDYLAQRGHLCLAKYHWPIVVNDEDAAYHDRDAVQMPVLERLGLVTHEDLVGHKDGPDGKPQEIHGRGYSLTPEGQKYYLHFREVVQTNAMNRVVHDADFCAATLTLDRVYGWEPPKTYDGKTRTSVLYTYHITPAPWALDPEAQRVFPWVGRIINGEGKLQLREGMTLTPKGWVADELL